MSDMSRLSKHSAGTGGTVALAGMLWAVLGSNTSSAFVLPRSTFHQTSSVLHQTTGTSSTSTNTAVLNVTEDVPQSTPSTSKPNYASYSKAQILEAQGIAEAKARSIFDPFTMNALFVNVEERPEPTMCTISPDSPTSSLPLDLPRGCLLKIGPNGGPVEEGWLDGDGLVHVITLPPDGEGDIMYSSTYVDTKGRQLETEKGDTFTGTLGAAPQGLPMLSSLLRNGLTFGTTIVQKDTCNTALAVSGDRVLALMEQSPPSEIKISKTGRMRTLENFARLDGAIPPAPINGGALGAHGRTDPVTGERVHLSYQSNSPPFVRVDTFSDDWKLKNSIGIDVPCPVMIHDVVLTTNYFVIFDLPLTIRPRRMFLGNKFPVEYEPENGARIGLTPRGRNKDETVWFEVESGVVLHAVNGYEREDGMVVIHALKSVPEGPSSFILDYTAAFLHEWVLDPATGKTINDRCLNPDEMAEFPTCHVSGEKALTGYGLSTTTIGGPLYEFKTPNAGVTLDGVVKFALEDDAASGSAAGDVVDRFDLPTGWHCVSEATTVTKSGGNGHYVLLIATFVPPSDDHGGNHVEAAEDGKSMRSQLLILDGDSISNGPVTSIDLPYHVNYGLHSSFIDWDIME